MAEGGNSISAGAAAEGSQGQAALRAALGYVSNTTRLGTITSSTFQLITVARPRRMLKGRKEPRNLNIGKC